MRKKIILVLLLVALGLALGAAAALLLGPKLSSAPPVASLPRQTQPPVTQEPVPTPADPAVPAVQAAFLRFLKEQYGHGRWSLYYASLAAPEPVWYATDQEPLVSASLIKLPIMVEVYEQLRAGTLEHDRVYPLLSAMITVSDNAAANELIALLGGGEEAAGMEAVNAWCRRQGWTATRLNRLMLAENGLQNYTDAGECAQLLAAIYQGSCVSPEASAEMLALLLAQEVNDRLPALLPEGTPVAHKTGDLPGLSLGDVGIVYSPAGDYLLCVVGNDLPDDDAARQAIAVLSRTVYDLVNGEGEGEPAAVSGQKAARRALYRHLSRQ